MSVTVEPQELNFRRPFVVDEVAQILKIKNLDDYPVAFKVKTTAPKYYCVRPNSGRIEPGQEVDVTVLLQVMKQEPPPDFKCRDKFLVQSVAITSENGFESASTTLDTSERHIIHDRKIRVNWLSADGGDAEGVASSPSRNRLSSGNAVDTDAETSKYFATSGNESTSFRSSAPPPYSYSTVEEQANGKPEPASSAAPASPSVAAVISPTYDELKLRLAEAETKLRENSEREIGGLRYRGDRPTITTSSDTKDHVVHAVTRDTASSTGVPVRIVAMLCFVSFLMAYFFF